MRTTGNRLARAGGFPYLAMLCLLIAVSLFSALAPLGPPASRHVGSAFSPATTAVAIKSRVADTPVIVRPALSPGFDLTPAVLWPILLAPVGFLFWKTAFAPIPVADKRPLFLGIRRPARAPPRA